MADVDMQKQNAQRELEALAVIEKTEDRAKAIQLKASIISEQTGISVEEVIAGMTAKVDAVIEAQAKPPSDYVTNFMPSGGQVVAGMGVAEEGVTGGGLTLQTQSLETKAGNFAAFANANMDADGAFNTAGFGAKYVSPALKSENLTGVGIGVVSASVPLDGNDFQADNVGITAGAAIWHNSTGISSISTVSTDGKFGSLVLSQDFSKNFIQTEGGTSVSSHINGSYDIANDTGSVGVGVMAKTPLDESTSAWVGADIKVQNVGSQNDFAGQLNAGLNFGENNSASRASEKVAMQQTMQKEPNHYVESEMMSRSNAFQSEVMEHQPQAIQPQQDVAEKSSREGEGTISEMSRAYYALANNKDMQNKYLNDAAKVFSENSPYHIARAKEIVLNLFEYEHEKQLSNQVELERT